MISFATTIKPDSKKYFDIAYRHAQKFYGLSPSENLCIAKEFAAGKLRNYVSLFRQKYIREQSIFIAKLEEAIERICQAGDISEVRGIEGFAARETYARLNLLIDHEPFHITKRSRYKPDRINSLMNFGYYLLFSRINATVRALGLNPYLGFLHSAADNYESLVCDIEELFRPRIDRFIIRLINLKIIKEDDFTETERGMYLKRDAVKRYLSQFEGEMIRKKSKNVLSLGETIYAQTAIIRNWVQDRGSLTFYVWDV